MRAVVCLPSLSMPHLFIKILHTAGILFFSPCRLADDDACLFNEVHPLRTAATCYAVCWAGLGCCTALRLQKTQSLCLAMPSTELSVIQEQCGAVGGRSWRGKKEWPQKQEVQKRMWTYCKVLFIYVVLWKKYACMVEEQFPLLSHRCNLCSEMCVN